MPQRARLNSFTSRIGGAMLRTRILRVAIFVLLVASLALTQTASTKSPARTKSTTASSAQGKSAPTLQEAEVFMKKAEEQAEDLGVRASRAGWVQENFITDDTEIMSAQA